MNLLGNDFASKTLNPNPFVVLQYVGDGEISPSIDHWYDQSEEPLVVDTNTDLFNIFLAKENVKESFSSLFNSFVVNWVGTSTSFTTINSLGEVNTQQANATVLLVRLLQVLLILVLKTMRLVKEFKLRVLVIV